MIDIFVPFSPDSLNRIKADFYKELVNSKEGKKTSISFIRHPLPANPLVKDNEIFQVINVGGSFFEKALVKKSGKAIKIIKYEKGSLPVFENREILLSFLKSILDPEISKISLNFAYPLKPILRNNILDGRLIHGSKEHNFSGLIGKVIGSELEKFIYNEEKRIIKVAVANDTICLILSGTGIEDRNKIIGGIVGTGTNFGFFLDKKTIVNLESGDFNNFEQSEIGKEIDKSCLNPGKHLFEKEIAGAYLFKHYNANCKKFHLQVAPISSTAEISEKAGKASGTERYMAKRLIEHSASLVASEIAAIYLFKKQKKLTFLMEGSLFWKGYGYRQIVVKYLSILGIKKNCVQFKKLRNSNIIGGAQLALVSY